jgi:hypothetical protein
MKKVIYLFLLALVFSPFNSFAITSSQNYSNVSSEEEILNLISQLQKKLEEISEIINYNVIFLIWIYQLVTVKI